MVTGQELGMQVAEKVYHLTKQGEIVTPSDVAQYLTDVFQPVAGQEYMDVTRELMESFRIKMEDYLDEVRILSVVGGTNDDSGCAYVHNDTSGLYEVSLERDFFQILWNKFGRDE